MRVSRFGRAPSEDARGLLSRKVLVAPSGGGWYNQREHRGAGGSAATGDAVKRTDPALLPGLTVDPRLFVKQIVATATKPQNDGKRTFGPPARPCA